MSARFDDSFSELEGEEVAYDVGYSQKADFEMTERNRRAEALLGDGGIPDKPVSIVALNYRVKCDKCGFIVKGEGHYLRCRVQPSTFELELQRKRAWFGDAWQACHVRWLLIRVDLPVVVLQIEAEKYVGAVGQGVWYDAYRGQKLIALGISEHSVSTAFEASYYLLPQFRFDYIKSIAKVVGHDLIDGELQHLLRMFRFESDHLQLQARFSDKFVQY